MQHEREGVKIMAENTTVILSEGGTAETIVFAKDIEIKDLWHTAMGIKNGAFKDWSEETREEVFNDIIEVWTLAHHLKKHIIKQ